VPPAILLLLVLVGVPPGDGPAGTEGEAPSAETLRRVIDIPRAQYSPIGRSPSPPLRRSVDLLQMDWDGRGVTAHRGPEVTAPDQAISLIPVPWHTSKGSITQLVTRSVGLVSEEATLSLVLPDRGSWCTSPLELEPQSRLRFDAVALGSGGGVRLNATWEPRSGTSWSTTVDTAAPADPAGRPVDEPLPAGHGVLCLEARGGTVSVGEPRIVAPEPPGEDPRPRWIVLVVEDALRGDVLDNPRLDEVAPALDRLARRGHRYEEAVSVGSHTQAALWPLLTGRYLARLDPRRARRSAGAGLPLEVVYSRGSLLVSHLARDAGYHTVFLGNNSFLRDVPAFDRFTNRGKADTGTIDTIAALPPTMERYADERVFLVYYISAPHGYSFTPRRLFEGLGCDRLGGIEASRCAYEARVAHADEALAALQEALEDQGLEDQAVQVLTADHGEVFGDARHVEIWFEGRWWNTAEGHGATSHWRELHVPLVVSGRGVSPAVWPGRVSLLDVVPTLARLGGFPTPLRLDGAVLPLSGGPRAPPVRLVSQGYCTHSVLEGAQQLLWWESECARRREPGTHRAVTAGAELWRDGALEATDESAPERLRGLVRAHMGWLAAHLPGEAWLVDPSGLGRARLRATVADGRIVDWGPSRTVAHLDAFSCTLSPDQRRLDVDLRDYPGLLYIATWPPSAPIRFDVVRDGAAPPVAFAGPLQLPLAVLGRLVDPKDRPELWRATAEPHRQPSSGPHLRLWRQPYRKEEGEGSARAPNELDRVLREWGYIR
jgi:hypothetical protein